MKLARLIELVAKYDNDKGYRRQWLGDRWEVRELKKFIADIPNLRNPVTNERVFPNPLELEVTYSDFTKYLGQSLSSDYLSSNVLSAKIFNTLIFDVGIHDVVASTHAQIFNSLGINANGANLPDILVNTTNDHSAHVNHIASINSPETSLALPENNTSTNAVSVNRI